MSGQMSMANLVLSSPASQIDRAVTNRRFVVPGTDIKGTETGGQKYEKAAGYLRNAKGLCPGIKNSDPGN